MSEKKQASEEILRNNKQVPEEVIKRMQLRLVNPSGDKELFEIPREFEWPEEIRKILDFCDLFEKNLKISNNDIEIARRHFKEKGEPLEQKIVDKLLEMVMESGGQLTFHLDNSRMLMEMSLEIIGILSRLVEQTETYKLAVRNNINSIAREMVGVMQFFIERLKVLKEELDIDEESSFRSDVAFLRAKVPELIVALDRSSADREKIMNKILEMMSQLDLEDRVSIAMNYIDPYNFYQFAPPSLIYEMFKLIGTNVKDVNLFVEIIKNWTFEMKLAFLDTLLSDFEPNVLLQLQYDMNEYISRARERLTTKDIQNKEKTR